MSRKRFLVLAVLILAGLWLRAPFVSAGLPFFYQEDEAHHFNRVVNMVKRGTYNPNYFHKPSLHFYLRMPVVAGAFLWNVGKGHIRKVEEIRTEDRFGVGKYAFTASHEGIVKWNRAFSLLLSLLLIVFSYALARLLLGHENKLVPAAAALPVVLSPDLTAHSATVGVDILMAVMALACVLAALYTFRSFSLPRLLGCGILAGLAVSSKYNALPIAVIPLAVAVGAERTSWKPLFLAVVGPMLGFFLGSPFVLASLPLFLDQFAYEIWHYGIEGHEGHTGQPGLPQLVFFLGWLGRSALGYGFLALSILGIFVLILRTDRPSKLFLLFPMLFLWLMCEQKANFERNLLVLIPFLSIAATAGLLWVGALAPKRRAALAMGCVLAVCSIQPLSRAMAMRREAHSLPDSRRELVFYLNEVTSKDRARRIALSGQLQMPPSVFKMAGVEVVDQERLAEELKKPYDVLIVHGPLREDQLPYVGGFAVRRNYEGEPRPFDGVRVMRNPLIQVFEKKDEG